MLRFTSNRLDLDLSHLNITFTETNVLFQDELSSEYSFPFDIPAKLLAKINDYTSYNTAVLTKQEKGYLYRDGVIDSAVLKLHEIKGNMVSCVLYAGTDVLSKLDVDLKDLGLMDFTVDDIAEHALGVIPLQYPEVNYNFPMVFTDKYNDNSDFAGFKGIYNNYENGQFLENEINEDTGDVINNIMQPMPYLLYVLTAGFASVGMELKGDVLTDPDLLKALLFRDGEYYINLQRTDIPINISVDDFQSKVLMNTYQHSLYSKTINVERKGDYVLNGSFTNVFVRDRPFGYRYTSLTVKITKVYNGVSEVLYDQNQPYTTNYLNRPVDVITQSVSIDVDLQLEEGTTIIIEKTEVSRDGHNSVTPDYPDTVGLTLYPVRYRHVDGTPVISVENIDAVQLGKVVPDMTLKDLVNIVRTWKNLNYILSGNIVTMDYVQPALDRTQALNLSDYEIEEPTLDYSEEKSYELTFADGAANDGYIYDKLFIDADGVKTNTYKTKSETTPITIDALPLPIITRNGVKTAYALDDDTSKVRLVFYRALLEGGKPVCNENTGMLLPAVYQNNYKRWLDFRISSVKFTWQFLAASEKVRELTTKKPVYAYGNYHIITEMEKTQDRQYYDIVLKSESLR